VRLQSTLPAFRSTLLLILLAALAVAAPAAGQGGSGGIGTDPPAGTSGKEGSAKEAKYLRIWNNRISAKDKRWAHDTAMCETGKDPNATALGGRFRGAFMFLRSSWKNSPKSPGGDPIDYSYKTQAVIAVLLKKQLGTKPWPACG
jgi:Transglycosylase-like domain